MAAVSWQIGSGGNLDLAANENVLVRTNSNSMKKKKNEWGFCCCSVLFWEDPRICLQPLRSSAPASSRHYPTRQKETNRQVDIPSELNPTSISNFEPLQRSRK